jgi:hypothetical protein
MSEEAKSPWQDDLMSAIENREPVLVHYNGEVRPIEPHLLGRTTRGNLAVRVWQLAGGSRSQHPVPGWRMMRLDRITHLERIDAIARVPRPEYNPDDQHMAEILARV